MHVHTHYDNLKVPRDASSDVICAAFVLLSDKYSPQRCPRNQEAARILRLVTAAYNTLSSPEKREQHDRWISEQEGKAAPDADFKEQETATTASATAGQWHNFFTRTAPLRAHLSHRWGLYLLAAIVIGVWVTYQPDPTKTEGTKSYRADLSVPHDGVTGHSTEGRGASRLARDAYMRPTHAPNGVPWPTSASYIGGYKHLRVAGFSKVTIDNAKNTSDVFVKLVSIDGEKNFPVRVFYIPQGESFTVTRVSSGRYDIRYDDLSNGTLWRTEPFTLDEKKKSNGVQYSEVTMTLYKVPYGNMQTYPISASQF